MRADVLVVGAGPAGSTAAASLAKDHEVILLEEHEVPGSPMQCAGLVTPRGIPSFANRSVVNRVRGARIHSPLGFTLSLEAKDTKACVVDRRTFDSCLYEHAIAQGAKPLLGHKVTDLRELESAVSVSALYRGGAISLSASALIGCDGYRSVAHRYIGARPARHMLRGIQVDLKGLQHDPDFVDLYLGNEVAPGFFAWSIPAGEVVRVGLCVHGSVSTPQTYLSRLLSRPEFSGGVAVQKSSGKIPVGPGKSAVGDLVLLAGDAACHAKPLSGGGIYTGIRGAELAASCARSYLASGDRRDLQEYDTLWREEFGKELAKAFRIRKVFLALDDRKMDRALRMFDDPEILSLLQRDGDIDYPASLSQRVLKLAPKLAQFSPQLIESLLK